MTKSEQIKMLQLELKDCRSELKEQEAELKKFRDREQSFVIVEETGSGVDERGYYACFTVRSCPAPFGSGMFDAPGFHRALEQFIKKWNSSAVETCQELEKNVKVYKRA